MATLKVKNPKMEPKNPPGFWTYETSSWILTSNQLFWPEPIYWDINFVLKCLTAHCEAHRPPIENQCFHQVQWLTLQKPLPFHVGQNGCLYSHFTSFLCLPMTAWLRWLDMSAGSLLMDRLTNGWLQLKTNAFIEFNGWLSKSHCHSTLAKMVAYQWEWIR